MSSSVAVSNRKNDIGALYYLPADCQCTSYLLDYFEPVNTGSV
jgi:hypothetical protein